MHIVGTPLLALVPILALALAPRSALAQGTVSMRVETGDSPGSLADVRHVLARWSPSLSACYAQRVDEVRTEGRLDLLLTVPAGASTPRVGVERRSFEADPDLEACFIAVMSAVRLVPQQAPRTFVVSLVLTAPPRVSLHDIHTMRGEVATTRAESRCLARAASRLERLAGEWERAPRRRRRLEAAIIAAREALRGCSLRNTLGAALQQADGQAAPRVPGPCDICIDGHDSRGPEHGAPRDRARGPLLPTSR